MGFGVRGDHIKVRELQDLLGTRMQAVNTHLVDLLNVWVAILGLDIYLIFVIYIEKKIPNI